LGLEGGGIRGEAVEEARRDDVGRGAPAGGLAGAAPASPLPIRLDPGPAREGVGPAAALIEVITRPQTARTRAAGCVPVLFRQRYPGVERARRFEQEGALVGCDGGDGGQGRPTEVFVEAIVQMAGGRGAGGDDVIAFASRFDEELGLRLAGFRVGVR